MITYFFSPNLADLRCPQFRRVELDFWKSKIAGNLRKTARGVPKTHDFNDLFVAPQPVDDSIGTTDYFPQILLLELWNNSANVREICHAFGAGDQFETKADRGVGVVLGHVADNT